MNRNQFDNLTRQLLALGRSRGTLPTPAGVLARTRMMLLAALAALVALAALLPNAPAIEAKVVQDGHCGLTTSGTYLLGSKAYAESFTASHTGKLISGFVETYNVQDDLATYTVELWTADVFGVPTGTAALASATVDHPRSGYEVDYPAFATPAKVKAGHTYALVVRVPDPSINGVTVVPSAACDTFTLSDSGAIGSFQYDRNNRELRFSVNVKVRRHRHHH